LWGSAYQKAANEFYLLFKMNFFFISLLVAAASAQDWQLHLLNTSFTQQRGAFCLDGSNPGFYFKPGRGADASKFKVGGGIAGLGAC
jgi:hypothetical protein